MFPGSGGTAGSSVPHRIPPAAGSAIAAPNAALGSGELQQVAPEPAQPLPQLLVVRFLLLPLVFYWRCYMLFVTTDALPATLNFLQRILAARSLTIVHEDLK